MKCQTTYPFPIRFLWFLFFFLGTQIHISAQPSTEKYTAQINQIVAGIQTDPIGTKKLLDNFLDTNPDAPDSIKGFVMSNIAVTYGIRNLTDSGIGHLSKAIPLLTGNKKILAIKNMGNFYRIKGDYQKAIAQYRQAIEINDKIGNKSIKARILGEWASVYYDLSDFEQSIQLSGEAIKLDQELGAVGKAHELMMRGKMANTFIANSNFEFARKELEQLAAEQKSMADQSTYMNTRMLLGVAYTSLNQYSEANKSLKEALAYYKGINNTELYGYTLATMAENEEKNGNSALGLTYIKGVFYTALTKNYTRLPEYACTYLELLNKSNRFEEGKKIIALLNDNALMKSSRVGLKLRYKTATLPFIKQSNDLSALVNAQDSVIQLSEQKLIAEKNKVVNEMQAKYQTAVTEKNNKILQQEKEILSKSEKNKTWLLLLSIAISLIIVLLFSIGYYKKSSKSKLQEKEMEQQKLQYEFLQSKSKLEIEQRKLKEQIIEQQKAELLKHATETAQLRNKLTSMIARNEQEDNQEIFTQLNQLKEDKKHWEHFMARFNATFPEFTKKLSDRFPDLTNADLQFCSLLRLNLNNKEIASVLNIEPISIYKKRSRLMDKMKLKDGDSIESVLMEVG